MLEIFFGIITRPASHRGTFHSVADVADVADVAATIASYPDGWNNERTRPFT